LLYPVLGESHTAGDILGGHDDRFRIFRRGCSCELSLAGDGFGGLAAWQATLAHQHVEPNSQDAEQDN
jgi:hypothetical protein